MNKKFLFLLLANLPVIAQLALAQEPGCDVQLTGANPQHFFAPYKLGATGAASDFWLTAGQKKATNAGLDKALGQKTAAEDSTHLVGPLVLNCTSEDGKNFWLFVELCKTPAPDGKMASPNSTTSQPWTTAGNKSSFPQ